MGRGRGARGVRAEAIDGDVDCQAIELDRLTKTMRRRRGIDRATPAVTD